MVAKGHTAMRSCRAWQGGDRPGGIETFADCGGPNVGLPPAKSACAPRRPGGSA